MKNKKYLTTAFLVTAFLFLASCGPVTVIQSDSYQPAPAPVEDVSYQSFYDQLAPYGTWINYPGYGYVWMPNAGPDFQPYSTNGNWIYTDAGWTWSSNYNWGWAPFHYGRWFYENGYGWMWVPGNEWAPAWVSWRSGGDYYGWAPMGPRITTDIALSSYNPPANYWNFVPRHYMGNPDWHNYYVDRSRNVTIINNTTIINNYSGTNRSRYSYAPGPDPDEVRRYSGNNFTQAQIRESNTPGERVSGSQYVIYHPRVTETPAARGDVQGRPATPAPARYESFNNMRPAAQNQNNQRPASASQNPGYTPPVNNPRPMPAPATQNAYNNTPGNNPQNYNQANSNPANNNPRPVGNTRTANQQTPVYTPPVMSSQNSNPPNNNPRPVQNNNVQQDRQNQIPAATSRPNDGRAYQFRQTPAQQNQHPVQTSPVPQPSPVNRVPSNAKPATNQNPNNGHTDAKPASRQPKPDDKPTEKPKTREANN